MLPHNGSINHHYIPQFYLKGFCRDDGTFDVYDKSIGKFKKAPQTPAIIFFEPKRNNIRADPNQANCDVQMREWEQQSNNL